ncbi:MAG: PLDc N-terminal domain-containing protein [Bryobacterales bacterium]
MENPILWVLLVLFLSVIGLVIYLVNRPKAN